MSRIYYTYVWKDRYAQCNDKMIRSDATDQEVINYLCKNSPSDMMFLDVSLHQIGTNDERTVNCEHPRLLTTLPNDAQSDAISGMVIG